MTDSEINRAVSLKFNIWKEWQNCTANRGFEKVFDENDFCIGRECQVCHWRGLYVAIHCVPPPDLLSPSGADLLMTALQEKLIRVVSQKTQGYALVHGKHQCTLGTFTGYGPTWIHALRDAAWKLCEGEKSNA